VQKEIEGVTFEWKDNGVQRYWTTTANGIVWDVGQNRGETCWWVWAHRRGAITTVNEPGSPNTLPGVLWEPGGHQQPADYWMKKVAGLIRDKVDPWSMEERTKKDVSEIHHA